MTGLSLTGIRIRDCQLLDIHHAEPIWCGYFHQLARETTTMIKIQTLLNQLENAPVEVYIFQTLYGMYINEFIMVSHVVSNESVHHNPTGEYITNWIIICYLICSKSLVERAHLS
jgi:hypothetical protein